MPIVHHSLNPPLNSSPLRDFEMDQLRMNELEPKFPLGRVVATPGVLEDINRDEIQVALSRHVRGDWGELCKDDLQANEDALVEGARLLSKYRGSSGVIFWIITEWDRSVTTVLLPSEY